MCIQCIIPYIGLFSLLKYFRECLQSRKIISRILFGNVSYDDAVLQHCHGVSISTVSWFSVTNSCLPDLLIPMVASNAAFSFVLLVAMA